MLDLSKIRLSHYKKDDILVEELDYNIENYDFIDIFYDGDIDRFEKILEPESFFKDENIDNDDVLNEIIASAALSAAVGKVSFGKKIFQFVYWMLAAQGVLRLFKNIGPKGTKTKRYSFLTSMKGLFAYLAIFIGGEILAAKYKWLMYVAAPIAFYNVARMSINSVHRKRIVSFIKNIYQFAEKNDNELKSKLDKALQPFIQIIDRGPYGSVKSGFNEYQELEVMKDYINDMTNFFAVSIKHYIDKKTKLEPSSKARIQSAIRTNGLAGLMSMKETNKQLVDLKQVLYDNAYYNINYIASVLNTLAGKEIVDHFKKSYERNLGFKLGSMPRHKK